MQRFHFPGGYSQAIRENFEMAVASFLWLLSNQKFYRNVFRITFWVIINFLVI